jgi:hypothetical protein
MNAIPRSLILLAFVVATLTHQPATAATTAVPTPVVGLTSFSLDKREVKKGETVVATYTLSQPATAITVTASTPDSSMVGFSLPQTHRPNARRTAGIITFTVPAEAATISPLFITLNIDGNLRGLNTLRISCDFPWFFSPRVSGCPYAPPVASPAAVQHFERGAMLWLQATNSVYVLLNEMNTYTNDINLFLRFEDTFKEGMIESDLYVKPPEGKFQPIRGFGKVWRENPRVMNQLGWAVDKEQGYTACYAAAFGGWRSMHAYVTTPRGEVVTLETSYAPIGWRVLTQLDSKPVKIDGC